MNKKYKLTTLVLFVTIVLEILAFLGLLLHNANFAILNPQGLIASRERDLILFASALALTVVLPVFALTFFIAWKFRSSNVKDNYYPGGVQNHKQQLFWWLVPALVVGILAVITWQNTHDLDPLKPIYNGTKPITIQVVALQWKWLFIYPEENIATVNFVQFPTSTPLNFKLTADAPMNSFWIPQLGGQMYAMAGMATQLHLIANEKGNFAGQSAEMSGRGFAGMKFVAKASSKEDFDIWVKKVKESIDNLDFTDYNKLASPSENNPVIFYATAENDLYNKIIMKFMNSPETHLPMQDMEH